MQNDSPLQVSAKEYSKDNIVYYYSSGSDTIQSLKPDKFFFQFQFIPVWRDCRFASHLKLFQGRFNGFFMPIFCHTSSEYNKLQATACKTSVFSRNTEKYRNIRIKTFLHDLFILFLIYLPLTTLGS